MRMLICALLAASWVVGHASDTSHDTCGGTAARLSLPGDRGDVFGVFASFGTSLNASQVINGQLASASPRDACSQLSADMRGAIVLVERGGCSFTDKATAVQASGASALLLYDNQTGCIGMGAANKTDVEGISITCVSVTRDDGLWLVSLTESMPQAPVATLVHARPPPVDASMVLLWAMAIGTFVGGALWRGLDHAGEGALKGAEGDGNTTTAGIGHTPVEMTLQGAVWFVVMASAMLLALFFFVSDAFIYLMLLLFCIASFQAVTVALTPAIRVALPCMPARTFKLKWLGVWRSEELVAAVIATLITEVWFEFRAADWAWVLQDVQGICLIVLLMRSLKVTRLKVAALFLGLTFVYDVFFVFLEPLIFGGQSVMVAVATSNGLHEALPMLLRVPIFWLPRDVGGYAMLGFGDIAIPGLLGAYLRCVDVDVAAARRQPHRHGDAPSKGATVPYFPVAAVAYALGLALTYVALAQSWFGDQGQPALLYLVPCTLGSTALLAWLRGEWRLVWEGTSTRQRARTASDPGHEPEALPGAGTEPRSAEDLEAGEAAPLIGRHSTPH